MPVIRNGNATFNAIPKGYPVPGETIVYDGSKTIDPDNVRLNGGFLIKTLVLSIDPYLRGRMRPADQISYSRCFMLTSGYDRLYSHGIGVVLRSENTACNSSDAKVEFMKSLGADVAFNYKTTSTVEVLEDEGPIDVYWDNVGGETLEAALDAARRGARFIECGMISGYNGDGKPINNLFQVISKEITISGFIVMSLEHKYREEFYATVPAKLASGELKYTEDVTEGLDKVGDVMLAMLQGKVKQLFWWQKSKENLLEKYAQYPKNQLNPFLHCSLLNQQQ